MFSRMTTTERLDARLRGEGPAPSKPSRRRPVAAAALLAVLAIAWLAFSRGHTSSGAAPSPDAVTVPEITTVPAPDTSVLRRLLRLDPSTCVDLVADVPAVSCTVAGVHVDARLVGAADETRAYVEATGARLGAATGDPACARGSEEERSWSRPSAPSLVAGRYACRHEPAGAALWWTDEHGVLAHATTENGDLAQLFAWWRGHLLG